MRCEFNEPLFLSNIDLRNQCYNFVLSEFVHRDYMHPYFLAFSEDSQMSYPLSSSWGACWPRVGREAMVRGCGLLERV